MCRIAAYLGPETALEDVIIKPVHSLLTQSQHASEAKLEVNGDGFGLAWYGASDRPGLYRDVLPAWADENLVSLCRMVRSRLFIGHIRASTMGETSRQNCHPFTAGNWSFCHNGQVPHFPRIRRRLEEALPDEIYDQRRGTTDSEMLFLTLLANGLKSNPAQAFESTLADLGRSTPDGPVRLTCVASDGHALYAFRYASDGRCPTLYSSREWKRDALVLASEPLCGNAAKWEEIAPNTLVRFTRDDVSSSEIGGQLAA